MKSLAHYIPATAFVIYAAVTVSSLPATGIASTADAAARALSQHMCPATAMDSPQSRTPMGDLQREKVNRGTMPGATTIERDPRYHFYGGQY